MTLLCTVQWSCKICVFKSHAIKKADWLRCEGTSRSWPVRSQGLAPMLHAARRFIRVAQHAIRETRPTRSAYERVSKRAPTPAAWGESPLPPPAPRCFGDVEKYSGIFLWGT